MVVLLRLIISLIFAHLVGSSSPVIGIKSALLTPQTGQVQLFGISTNSVPGRIPLSSSPISGS
jgi:hypothetical protein